MGILRQVSVVTTQTNLVCYIEPNRLLDIYPTAMVAYSFRKLKKGYSGSAVRIRRSSDNAEQDIGFDFNGNFDAASASSFISGGSGFVVKWYDQSGNSDDISQATVGKQPNYVASGIGSLPCASFFNSGSGSALNSGTNVVALGGTTLTGFCVAFQNGGNTNARLIAFQASGQSAQYDNVPSAAMIERHGGANAIDCTRNNVVLSQATITISVPNVLASIFDGANHTMYVDAVASASVASSGSFGATGTFTIGEDTTSFAGISNWNGQVSEAVAWAADQTSNVAGIDGNMGSYYGL